MDRLSHTPPNLPFGSIGREPSQMKRMRSNSVSGRLRSASKIFEDGVIDQKQKSKLKEMIIADDPKALRMIQRYNQGDASVLDELRTNDSATQIDLLEGLNLSTLHGLTFDDVESGSVPKEEMLKDLFNLDDYDYEYDMYGAGSANSLGSDNIKGERRGSTFSNLATSPSIFDMDLLGDEGAADYPTEPSSYEGKDQLVLLEKLTDSFANSEDRRNKNRSGSTMSLSAAFRDDFKSDAILGNGSANSRSNPVAIPNQKARGRQASANVASQRARKPQQHKKVNSTQQPAVYAPNVSKTDGSTHMVDGEQKKSTEGNKIGAYSPNSRNKLVLEFLAKRQHRSWKKKVKYGVRKKFADSRLRVKGRFVKKEDEAMLRLYLLMCF